MTSRRIFLALAISVAAGEDARARGGEVSLFETKDRKMSHDLDRVAIHTILAAQDAAWSRGDADGFAADTTEDVVFTNVVGLFTVGRAPFTRQSARIFAGRYRGSRLVQTVDHITFVRPDVAIVNTMLAVTGYASLPPGALSDDGVLRTRCEQVMAADDGHWRVASFHNVPVNVAAIAAAGPP